MGRFPKPCYMCGALSRDARCATCEQLYNHRRNGARHWYLDKEYKRNRTKLLATATTCGICGGGYAGSTNPWTVDHVQPASKGGTGTLGNLRVVHKLCNSKRGNKTTTDDTPGA